MSGFPESNVSSQSSRGTKRKWVSEEDAALVSCMVDLHNVGTFNADTGFKAGYLNELEKMLEKILPNAMLKAKPDIESRIKLLKRDWSIVYDMLNGKNNSDFGWDEHRQLVVVEDAVWNSYINSHKEAGQFKHRSLGAAATVCGIVIGAMAVAQVFSSVYFSAWSNRSYFRPLVFSSIVLFVGNTMYALAYDMNSLTVLILGRLFCGLGSARAVNRRYISDCVPLKIRMQASAGFVSASALGMACGPALAGILQTNFKIYKLTFNANTLPGWVMAVAWLVYLVWLWISFKEPSRDIKEPPASSSETLENGALEEGKQPLLITSEEKQEDDEDPEGDGSEEAPEESRQPATSIVSAYRLLTPSVKVQLLIYFMLKYAMEILLSESSVITTYYFTWSTSTVSIFLACLGLTVLPVNIVVGSYISNMFEDRQILLASEIMVCIGILLSFHMIIPYTIPQYVCSGLIMFVSAEVLEGVNLSLLSRVMSSRLSRGTYNGGLLSTEAGTIARVIADATITLAGYLGESRLLNITLLPSFLICVASIVATCFTYNSLY